MLEFAQILSVTSDPATFAAPLNFFCSFVPVFVSQLKDIVAHMKVSGSSCDVIPSTLFKEVSDLIGTSVLSIYNSCMSTGIVPNSLKHAIIHPLLKKVNLRFNRFQSGFTVGPSTESVLLRV